MNLHAINVIRAQLKFIHGDRSEGIIVHTLYSWFYYIDSIIIFCEDLFFFSGENFVFFVLVFFFIWVHGLELIAVRVPHLFLLVCDNTSSVTGLFIWCCASGGRDVVAEKTILALLKRFFNLSVLYGRSFNDFSLLHSIILYKKWYNK